MFIEAAGRSISEQYEHAIVDERRLGGRHRCTEGTLAATVPER